IEKAGFNNIKRQIPKNNTKKYLKPGNISRKEKRLLNEQGNFLEPVGKRRRIVNNLPADSGIKPMDLPKYCHYRSAYKNRGDYFIIDGHPSLNGKIWQTTSSKKVSINKKFNELIDCYNNL
ncbi:MAG: hypothetical protein GTN36_03545, partial [Candidatus Aenigmarchaeota archaeon]|nr:hypothetical protein [Candidatus Aenigmarchaeota archaeon]